MSHRLRTVLGGWLALACVCGAAACAVALGDLRAAPAACAGLLATSIGGALLALRCAAALPGAAWLAGAVVARLLLSLGSPTLSDDEHRYVHEGRAQRLGLATPYREPPAAIVPSPDDGTTARVNHPEVPAAYPPGSELWLWLTIGIGDAVGAPRAPLRLTLLAADLWVLFALYRRRAKLPLAYLLYGLHPLPLLEVALSRHLDALGMALVFFAVTRTARPGLSGALIGLAMHVKPIGALTLLGIESGAADAPPRRIGRTRLRAAAVALVVAAALALPHLHDRAPLFSGFLEYATRWRASPIGFAVLEAPFVPFFEARAARGVYAHAHVSLAPPACVIEDAGQPLVSLGKPGPRARKILLDAAFVARLLSGLLLGVGVLLIARAALSGAARAGAALAVTWLLVPTLHSWYLLWVVPLAALTGSRALWTFSALAPLLYQPVFRAFAGGDWADALWPRATIVALTALAALLDWRSRRA